MSRLLVILLVLTGAPLTLSSVRPDAAGPSLHEEFATLSTADWDVYNSPGNAGQGLRRPSQVSVGGGVLTINGTADGTTGGMKWRNRSQTYGQWDIRMRTWKGCMCYHPVVLLWGSGSGVDNPNGEIDIVEVWQRPNRDRNSFSVHYGDGSQFVGGDVAVDITQWHVYHVVWQAQYIYTWIDDNPAHFSTTDTGVIPHGPMDVTIQLDWFPDEGAGGTGRMQVDSVTQYPQPVVY